MTIDEQQNLTKDVQTQQPVVVVQQPQPIVQNLHPLANDPNWVVPRPNDIVQNPAVVFLAGLFTWVRKKKIFFFIYKL
jgi:hypothetical protein